MELVDAVVEAAVSKEMEWGKTLVMPMGDVFDHIFEPL